MLYLVCCISDSASDRLTEQKLGNINSSNEEALISIVSIFLTSGKKTQSVSTSQRSLALSTFYISTTIPLLYK